MSHLWITPQEICSGCYQEKETDAHAEDPNWQAAHGNGYSDAKDRHAGIVVVIKNTFFGSYGPLQIIRGEKKEDQSFLKSERFPKTPQTDRHRRQAAPCDHRITHQIRKRALRIQIKRPGVPAGSNGPIRDRSAVEMPNRGMYRY